MTHSDPHNYDGNALVGCLGFILLSAGAWVLMEAIQDGIDWKGAVDERLDELERTAGIAPATEASK